MSVVAYVLIYCTSCGEQRKIAPERACELRKMGELEWAELRTLECPLCKGRMKRMPEYGAPVSPWVPQGLWPMSGDVDWMA